MCEMREELTAIIYIGLWQRHILFLDSDMAAESILLDCEMLYFGTRPVAQMHTL